MGYRSDIKIIAGKKAAAEFRKVNKKYDLFTETEGENGEWLFEADYLKWYEDDADYPDVAAYMEVVDKYVDDFKAGKNGGGMVYVRSGETDDDFEWRSNDGTTGSLYRTIAVEGFTPKPPPPPKPKVGKEFRCSKSFTHPNLGRMLSKGKIYVCDKSEAKGTYQMTAKNGVGCCVDTAFFKTHFEEIK